MKFDFTTTLSVLDAIAKVATFAVPGATFPAALTDQLLQILIRAKKAHEAITGKPLDLANLPDIPDIP